MVIVVLALTIITGPALLVILTMLLTKSSVKHNYPKAYKTKKQ
jgi:hypothetical protein